MLSGPTQILRIAHSSPGCVSPIHIPITQKAVSFEQGLSQDKAQQAQDAVHSDLLHEPYDPANPIVLEMLPADRDVIWILYPMGIIRESIPTIDIIWYQI